MLQGRCSLPSKEFLEQNIQQGQTLGFDGRVIAAMDGKKYEKVLAKTQICIAYEKDLADSIWTDRPDFPAGKVTVLNEKIAGKSVEETHADREKMAKDGANALLLTKLDDLMWLFNIRGCDVECNPVAMSYAYITEDTATLFIQQKALDTQGVRIPCSTSHRCEGIRYCRRLSEITSCRNDPRG